MAEAPETSLGYKVETWVIDMLRESEGIPEEFQIVNFNRTGRALSNRIVCIAKVGEQDLGGCQPFEVSLEVRLLMTEKDAEKLESYFKVIEETMRTFPEVDSADAFSFLSLEPAGDDEKEAKKEGRVMSRNYKFLAKEV